LVTIARRCRRLIAATSESAAVVAMVFPTTPLPAAKIGEDDTVELNGVPVPTFGTFIRNLCPGSAAGLPGLTLPAGLTKAGLPVGLASTGRKGATTSSWRSPSRSRPCCRRLSPPRLGSSLAPAGQGGY